MDKYDELILQILNVNNKMRRTHSPMKLSEVEKSYWKRIEQEKDLTPGNGRIGARITDLYLRGLVENKEGYRLTRKGRREITYLVAESS